MDASQSHQQGSPVLTQLPHVHRRSTHHGVPTTYSPRQQQPAPAPPQQLQAQMQANGNIYEQQEDLRQMFSQLAGLNTFGGARQHTGSQYQYGTTTVSAPGSGHTSIWTNGNTTHLQPPVFSQEQFQLNPFTGPGVITEFGGGFAPPIGVLGNAKAPNYTPPSIPQPTTPRRTSTAQESTAGASEANATLVPNPPELDAWREKLFHIDEMIVLTQQQYIHP